MDRMLQALLIEGLLPSSSTESLRLGQGGQGPGRPFQVFPEMVSWFQVTAQAGPLLHRVVPEPALHSPGCVTKSALSLPLRNTPTGRRCHHHASVNMTQDGAIPNRRRNLCLPHNMRQRVVTMGVETQRLLKPCLFHSTDPYAAH